jgi:enterochelin esterase family protein
MTQNLAINDLIKGPKTREAVDAFMGSHTFPIVAGNSCTFVWRGEAEAVHLKHWVFGLPSSQSLARIDGTDVWHLTIQLPPKSRVEYKLEVVRGGKGEWIQDPLNHFRARDPFGANSVAHSTGYEVPSWIQPDASAAKGHHDQIWIDSNTFGRREFGLYIPARFTRSRTYPVLVVHDGHDYMRYASLGPILDNLIDRLEIADAIVVLTSSPDRLREYADDERHAKFVVEELVPYVERLLPISGEPQSRCVMGASFGAVASLSAAYRYPGFFGRLLLQSGSFAFTDIGDRNHRGPLFDRIVSMMNRYRAEPTVVSEKVFVSVGMYESLIYENRSLVPVLMSTGMDVRYVEARDGHNWENWRDRLRDGLSWLLPGPFLHVYE